MLQDEDDQKVASKYNYINYSIEKNHKNSL